MLTYLKENFSGDYSSNAAVKGLYQRFFSGPDNPLDLAAFEAVDDNPGDYDAIMYEVFGYDWKDDNKDYEFTTDEEIGMGAKRYGYLAALLASLWNDWAELHQWNISFMNSKMHWQGELGSITDEDNKDYSWFHEFPSIDDPPIFGNGMDRSDFGKDNVSGVSFRKIHGADYKTFYGFATYIMPAVYQVFKQITASTEKLAISSSTSLEKIYGVSDFDSMGDIGQFSVSGQGANYSSENESIQYYEQMQTGMNTNRTISGPFPNLGKTQALGSTMTSRYYAYFMHFIKILKSTTAVSFYQPGQEESWESFWIDYNPWQLKGAAEGLKNGPLGPKPSELSAQNKHNSSYSKATMFINQGTAIAQQRPSHIAKCLAYLVGQADSHINMRNQLVRFFNTNSINNKYKDILDFYIDNPIGVKALRFVDDSLYRNVHYGTLTQMKRSRNFDHTSSGNYISSEQLTNMIKILSQENYGFLKSDDWSGKKLAFNVGIPAGWLTHARQSAYAASGDSSYLKSNIVAIHVSKVDDINPAIRYYPKTFVFDMSRYVIENINENDISFNPIGLMQGSQDFQPQLTDFTNTDISTLLDKHTICELKSGNLNVYQGNAYLTEGSSKPDNLNIQTMRSIYHNHLADYYLKLYFKTMEGIDYSSSKLLLTDNLESMSDLNKTSLLNNLRARLEILFNNRDEVLQSSRELMRIDNASKYSLFYSSELYSKDVLYPKIFDRIFTLFVNERDFILRTKDESNGTEGSYSMDPQLCFDKYILPTPLFRLDGGREVTTMIKPEFASNQTQQGGISSGWATYYNYYNHTLDPAYPQLYNYNVQIVLLKGAYNHDINTGISPPSKSVVVHAIKEDQSSTIELTRNF
tara:strand:+ start:25 stop:2616 length:2592 start_codon:yes stop_codon:yes gene_type:complete